MNSKWAVLESLVNDKKRGTRRRTSLLRGASQTTAGTPTTQDEIRKSRVGNRFQNVTTKATAVEALQDATRPADLRFSTRVQYSRLDAEKSREQQEFIGSVLNASALMKKTAEALQTFHGPIFGTEDEAAWSGMQVMNLIAKVIHSTKVHTAQTCWFEHVQALQERETVAKTKYEDLKQRFEKARTEYLKEVAMLRGERRAGGSGTGIAYYMDATDLLEPEEQKFVLQVVQEKIKMIFEQNPSLGTAADFSQLEHLSKRVESQDMKDMKNLLERRNKDLAEVRAELAHQKAVQRIKATHPLSAGVKDALDNQIDELQTKLWTERQGHQKELKRATALEAERSELGRRLQEEAAGKNVAQEELSRLSDRCDALWNEARAAEKKSEVFEQQIAHKNSDIKQLEAMIHPRQAPKKTNTKHVAHPKRADTKHRFQRHQSEPPERHASAVIVSLDGGLEISGPTSATQNVQKEKSRDSTHTNVHKEISGNSTQTGVGNVDSPNAADLAQDPETPSQELMEMTEMKAQAHSWAVAAASARDELLHTNTALEAECAQLRTLLREYVEGYVTQDAETLLDESVALVGSARSMAAHSTEEWHVRMCHCGGLFMMSGEEPICQSCGAKFASTPERPKLKERKTIVMLDQDLNEVADSLERAVGQLNDALKRSDSSGDKLDQTALASFVLKTDQEVMELRQQKSGIEARLLVERLWEAKDPCHQDNAGEREAMKTVLTKLQSICMEMSSKIQLLGTETMLATNAISRIRSFLLQGSAILDESKPAEVRVGMVKDVINEASSQSIFFRSYQASMGSRPNREQQRQQLLQKTCEALHLHVHQRSKAEMPPSKAQIERHLSKTQKDPPSRSTPRIASPDVDKCPDAEKSDDVSVSSLSMQQFSRGRKHCDDVREQGPSQTLEPNAGVESSPVEDGGSVTWPANKKKLPALPAQASIPHSHHKPSIALDWPELNLEAPGARTHVLPPLDAPELKAPIASATSSKSHKAADDARPTTHHHRGHVQKLTAEGSRPNTHHHGRAQNATVDTHHRGHAHTVGAEDSRPQTQHHGRVHNVQVGKVEAPECKLPTSARGCPREKGRNVDHSAPLSARSHPHK